MSSSSSSTPPLPPEDLAFTPEQQAAYDSAQSHLHESSSTFLALIPKLVSVEAYTPPSNSRNNSTSSNSNNNNPDEPDDLVTLISPARGHHELFRALDLLDGLEKEEQGLAAQMPLTRQLTALVMTGDDEATTSTTTNDYADSTQALRSLETLGQAVPRRVCQHPFKKNDIVWVCRTCQADETCVLCHACFSQSQHEGHDVAFYHAQAGGCCDCGDPDGKWIGKQSDARSCLYLYSGTHPCLPRLVLFSFTEKQQPGIPPDFVPAMDPTQRSPTITGRHCLPCWSVASEAWFRPASIGWCNKLPPTRKLRTPEPIHPNRNAFKK